MNTPPKTGRAAKSVQTPKCKCALIPLVAGIIHTYLGPSRRPRAKAQKRGLLRSLAPREPPLLKRGWARQPGLNQFPDGGEGHPRRLGRIARCRYVSVSAGDGDVEHGDARVRDTRLRCGGERDGEGGEAGQEGFRA